MSLAEQLEQGLAKALLPHSHRHGAMRRNLAFAWLDGILAAAEIRGDAELRTEAQALGYRLHEEMEL